jgi:ankyrin repeat protein
MHATLRIAGDDADKLRAKMGEGEIADVNELAYFGHSGSDGQTLLMVACKYGRVNIIKMLINEYKVCAYALAGNTSSRCSSTGTKCASLQYLEQLQYVIKV